MSFGAALRCRSGMGEASSFVVGGMGECGGGSRRGFCDDVSWVEGLSKPSSSPYRLSNFKMSAWLYDAPMTLRSGVGACFDSRWLLAEDVRQKGEVLLCISH